MRKRRHIISGRTGRLKRIPDYWILILLFGVAAIGAAVLICGRM